MSAQRLQLHRMRTSAYKAWALGMRSQTQMRGTSLLERQQRIIRNSAQIVELISHQLSA